MGAVKVKIRDSKEFVKVMRRVKDSRSGEAAKRLLKFLLNPTEQVSDSSPREASIRETIMEGFDFGCEKIIPQIKSKDVMLKIEEETDSDGITNVVVSVSIGDDTRYYGVTVIPGKTFDTLTPREVRLATNEVIAYLNVHDGWVK